jgi:CRISPR/Cas system-associated exonuclease Cas4 (RecB family)
MPLLLTLIIIAILIALTSCRLSKERGRAGITGWIRDQDLDGRGGKYHYNDELGIGCKPDIEQKGKIIEYKSASAGDKTMPGDILQVAAEIMVTGANEAELRYGNHRVFMFTKNSPEIKEAMARVIDTLQKMKAHLSTKTPPSAAPTLRKCAVCHFSKRCPESMVL